MNSYLATFLFWILVCSCLFVGFFGMQHVEEQRSVIKFFHKTGATPMACWREMQKAFGAETVTPKTVRMWMKKFDSRRTQVKDMPRSGCPRSAQSPGNIQLVLNAIQADRRSTISDISDATNVSKTGVHNIIKKDIKFSKLAPKFVPCLLTPKQKQFRMHLCELNLQSLRDDDQFLSKIVTGDESWVSIFEMELKKDSKEWHPRGSNSDHLIKAVCNRSVKKAMITVFFDEDGVIFSEYLPPRETVNVDYYCSVLRRLKEDIRRKCPALWGRRPDGYREFYLHHDNAPPHTAAITLGLIGLSRIDMVPHPPYSPDLAPCDFFLFPRLKSGLRGHRFQNLRDLKTAVSRELRAIDPKDYRSAIMSLPVRWMKCIHAQGGYFEGQHLEIDPLADHQLELVVDDDEDKN